VAPQDSQNCGRDFAKRKQTDAEFAGNSMAYVWLLLTICRHPSGMRRRWWRSVVIWRLYFFGRRSIFILQYTATIACLRPPAISPSAYSFFLLVSDCAVPLQCLWHESVTLISTCLIIIIIIIIVINTLLGRVTRHPVGMHCPAGDDAFVSSLDAAFTSW